MLVMGNNPMVGATVAVAVAVEEGMNKQSILMFIRKKVLKTCKKA